MSKRDPSSARRAMRSQFKKETGKVFFDDLGEYVDWLEMALENAWKHIKG